MKAVSLKIYHFSKWLMLVFLICIAVLSIAGRAILNNAESFKDEIVQELADYGIRGVSLENIEGDWQGLQPLLKIRGASLNIPGRTKALSVNELELRVKLVPSLLSGDLILESFYSIIDKIVLVRDSDGVWWLNDIPLAAQSQDESALDIYGFFQLLPSFVNIDIGLIQLRDLRHKVDYQIKNSTLRSSRKKQQLSLELIAQLPSSLGRKVHLQLKGNEVSQQLYVDASRLDLKQLLQLSLVEKTNLEKAILSFRSWIDLERFHFKKIITEATFSQIQIKNKLSKPTAVSFSLQQKINVDSGQWLVSSRVSNLIREEHSYPDINAQLLINQTDNKPRLWIDQIDLSLISSLLKEVQGNDSDLVLLDKLQPTAIINNMVAELDIINPLESLFSFDFANVNTRVYQRIPGIKGIHGSIISTQGKAQLNIDSQQVAMDFADLFRAPLKFNTLTARAFLDFNQSGVLVNSDQFTATNKDLKLKGRLWMESRGKGRPFLSLRANYQDGRASAVSKYLPVKIMPAKVVTWLDKSIQGGEIKHGDFLYHGRLVNPVRLDKKQSGIMHASIKLENPQVKYLDEWPAVGGGSGRLDFINAGMQLNFSDMQFAGSAVDTVKLDIPDFLKANLFIKTQSRSSAENLLKTLSQLPVLKVIKTARKKTASISGQVVSEVMLDIPLSKKLNKKVSVKARADLQDVALSIPEWMVGLKKMQGVVEIDNDKISASALSANYYGDPVQLSIKPESQPKRTKLFMTGDVHTQNLLKLVPEYLKNPVSGISPWNVSVSIAHKPTNKSPLLKIKALSELPGTELKFPQPVTLQKNEKLDFVFNAQLFDEGIFLFDSSLGNRVSTQASLNLSENSLSSLNYLKVLLGGDSSVLDNEGVSLAGNVSQLDFIDWFSYQKKYFQEETDSSSPFLQQIKSIDLDIDQLSFANQKTVDAKIKIFNDDQHLKGYIDSALVKGDINWPYTIKGDQPFVADLEYLKLKKSESEEDFTIEINDMPNLLIKSKIVSYEDMEFHDLILHTRKEHDNFIIKQLDLSRDKVQLKSSGHWQYEPLNKQHVSVFNIDIQGTNFGQTVNNLGLGETIKNGKVVFNGQIGWGGELFDMNWETLIGEVTLNLKDGYLRNIDPGAGRFVGLLSLNALPKRLFLDFGDVVKEGMQFNSIRGKFTLAGEILKTDNASMDSVSAKIKIKGNTNLRHQTYDQTMIIIPNVGDTLPLLGTLAAGSTVGWGLLLLQKIFKKPIEKSVEIEYKVTGGWNDPDVKLIPREIIDKQNDSFNEPDY